MRSGEALDVMSHPVPRESSLAAAAKGAPAHSNGALSERGDRGQVHGHDVLAHVPDDDGSHVLPRVAGRLGVSAPQFRFRGLEPGLPTVHASCAFATRVEEGILWSNSDSAAETYWVTEGIVATPVVSPVGGTYGNEVLITMGCETDQSTIRYTLDGSDPNRASPRYRWPFVVASTMTVKARAFRPGFAPSPVRAETYALDPATAVATPTIQPAGGWFTTWQRVTVTTATPDASIHYTTDGTDPTEGDPIVPAGGTIDIPRSLPLKARAFKSGLAASAVRRADFIITGAIAAGTNTSYALKADGTLWSWGDNFFGQTGTGTSSVVPLQVPGLPDIVQISSGAYHVLAVARDGSVWAWGRDAYGQLGIGFTGGWTPTPTRVPGIANVTAAAAGETHTLALAADGSLWAWGRNDKGQLGDGTTTEHLTPTRVPNFAGVRAVAAGERFSLALQDDGAAAGPLWAWGDNSMGQLGDGSKLNRAVPVKIAGVPPIIALEAGADFAHAIDATGSVWAWGSNFYGQLGDASLTERASPVHLPVFGDIRGLSDGVSIYAVAIDSHGTTWTWGAGHSYALGVNDMSNRAYPSWVTGIHAVISAAAGFNHALVATSDGKVYAWGANAGGTLGDGTRQMRPTPLRVNGLELADNSWLAGDQDDDGLPTWREYVLGTDPLNPDSNDDGIPDGASADAALQDADPDSDRDGVTNAKEAQLGTDPFRADSDGDDVVDGVDLFPLDPTRSQLPPPNPLDTTPPVVTLIEPTTARPIPPP